MGEPPRVDWRLVHGCDFKDSRRPCAPSHPIPKDHVSGPGGGQLLTEGGASKHELCGFVPSSAGWMTFHLPKPRPSLADLKKLQKHRWKIHRGLQQPDLTRTNLFWPIPGLSLHPAAPLEPIVRSHLTVLTFCPKKVQPRPAQLTPPLVPLVRHDSVPGRAARHARVPRARSSEAVRPRC